MSVYCPFPWWGEGGINSDISLLNPHGLSGVWLCIGGKSFSSLLVVRRGVHSVPCFFVTFHLASVRGGNTSICLLPGRYLAQHRPTTGAAGH